MSTKNPLPFSNQFERGHSFNWAGTWTSGKYYLNDEYVTDFIVYDNVIMACRRSHQATTPPTFVYKDGKIVDVDHPFWEFILWAHSDTDSSSVGNAEFIPKATQEDKDRDSSVIIGKPYIKLNFTSGAFVYIPVEDIITQYKVGVPVLTQAMYDELPDVAKPDPWLQIPDETDLTETDAGDYLNILFSAIRKLQAEVTKLRNSFQYGIQSYTGRDTAMSEVVDSYKDLNDEEPLWSIEEDALSVIPDSTMNFKAAMLPPLVPIDNFEYNSSGVVNINDYVTWTDPETGFLSNLDTKILLYLTLTSLDTNITLKGTNNPQTQLTFNLRNVCSLPVQNSEKYNVCVLVSRRVHDEDVNSDYGKNYIWISVGTFASNNILAEGYLNTNTRTLTRYRYELENPYTFHSVEFGACDLFKFNAYSKYQDFSHEVIPSKPNDDDYKYKVAHLTIRSVDKFETLEIIEDELLNDELIFVDESSQLWIKTKYGLKRIGGSYNPDEGMTEQEMLDKLKDMGIVYVDNQGLQLSDISDVTFINQDTGKKFKFQVDSEGDLKSTEIPEKTLAEQIEDLQVPIKKTTDYRGFIAKLLAGMDGKDAVPSTGIVDLGLKSDRVKIGAVYTPLKTDTKFGCTHGYIELENTSDVDIPLDGIYLHFLRPNNNNALIISHLELDGILPKGGTYLIRCKQYADKDTNSDVFISVDDFDKEWYENGELLDIRIATSGTYAFALTYGNSDGLSEISASTELIYKNQNVDSKAPHNYKWYFIDSIVFNANPSGLSNNACWALSVITSPLSNTITKTTFELDPAKQAYQALTTYDSSRIRFNTAGNVTTDVQKLNLNKKYIEFPLTTDKYPVSNYTPKSSKQHKNVSTDKTKLDKNKPNMVTCSFGTNIYTTRTFNWISCGHFDEYVWLKNGSSWLKFESYNPNSIEDSESYPRRKAFNSNIKNTIYNRIVGTFPGDLSVYTSHKCILELRATAVGSATTYTYMVGRADKNGNPDLEHCSEEYTFTLYPTTYTPRIYQITDQQGFHWIEYQVWAAAANTINERILADQQSENIIPILLNTGDMTQNGTRINEWLDYYNGGIELFKHLEQVNCVGNNDLCNTDPEILGTGDDNGKSNGYYFHVFYCYDTDENIVPIIVGDDNKSRYVPSLYYLDFENLRFIIVNSEITYANCDQWFDKHYGSSNQVVNVYTGWAVPAKSTDICEGYCSGFTTIYTMVYNMLNGAGNKNIIVACHEMPFTVITKDGLTPTEAVIKNYRSLSGSSKTSLIGSHTNQLTGNDNNGMHWLSRLLEYFHVKLCLGGHKHTYACTFPLCEYYYYDNGSKNSLDDGCMTMESTLENDDQVSWIYNDVNLSKKPIMDADIAADYIFSSDENHFSPITIAEGISESNKHHPVVYFMCQATGYKLTSNKELPSNYQHFSRTIPSTKENSDGDKPDTDQKYPMFAITELDNNTYDVKLIRIKNILSDSQTFTQQDYGTSSPIFEYAIDKADPDNPSKTSRQCAWTTTENYLISV